MPDSCAHLPAMALSFGVRTTDYFATQTIRGEQFDVPKYS